MGGVCNGGEEKEQKNVAVLTEEEYERQKKKQSEEQYEGEQDIDSENIANTLIDKYNKHENMPILTQAPYFYKINLDDAYNIQREFCENVVDQIAGYKIGFTNKKAQTNLAKKKWPALYGHVLNTIESENVIQLDLSKLTFLEAEIAYTVKKDITHPIAEIEHLKTFFLHLQPCVEVTQPPFRDPNFQRFMLEDLVAVNIGGTNGVILSGIHHNIHGDLDYLQVTLRENAEVVNTGGARDVVRGQWQSVLECVNFCVDKGWPVQKGMIVITGCMGRPVLARGQCTYAADFGNHIQGSIGEMEFKITGTDTAQKEQDTIRFWESYSL